MSIKPYLNTDGKISSAFLEGGGGVQNLTEVLTAGNDAGALNITNVGNMFSNIATINTSIGCPLYTGAGPQSNLTIGTSGANDSKEIRIVANGVGSFAEVDGGEQLRLTGTSLRFQGLTQTSAVAVGALASHLVIIAPDATQYKIPLFAMA
jgi:hypothetical protein